MIEIATKLTKETLKGIWAAASLSWDEDYVLDKGLLRENLRRLVYAEPHGIYVFGSTCEFYAVDDNEFRQVVDILVEEVGPSGIPMQAGCNALATHQVIEKMKYVESAGVSGAQVAVPGWMRLSEQEVWQFFSDVSRAVPDFPLISYNTERTKWYLYGEHYRNILEVAPNLLGIKWGGSVDFTFERFVEAMAMTPELAHFAGEPELMKALKAGAQGTYSAWVLMSPELTIKMFNLAEQGNWREAEAIHKHLKQAVDFIAEMHDERGLTSSDPAWDKGRGVISGFLAGHQRNRPPYMGWPDEAIAEMRARFRERYPELMFE